MFLILSTYRPAQGTREGNFRRSGFMASRYRSTRWSIVFSSASAKNASQDLCLRAASSPGRLAYGTFLLLSYRGGGWANKESDEGRHFLRSILFRYLFVFYWQLWQGKHFHFRRSGHMLIRVWRMSKDKKRPIRKRFFRSPRAWFSLTCQTPADVPLDARLLLLFSTFFAHALDCQKLSLVLHPHSLLAFSCSNYKRMKVTFHRPADNGEQTSGQVSLLPQFIITSRFN